MKIKKTYIVFMALILSAARLHAQIWDDFSVESPFVEANASNQDPGARFTASGTILGGGRSLHPTAQMQEPENPDVGMSSMQVRNGALEARFEPGSNSSSYRLGTKQILFNEPATRLMYEPGSLDLSASGLIIRMDLGLRQNTRIWVWLEDSSNNLSVVLIDPPNGTGSYPLEIPLSGISGFGDGAPAKLMEISRIRFFLYPLAPQENGAVDVEKIQIVKTVEWGWTGSGILLRESVDGRYTHPNLGALSPLSQPFQTEVGLFSHSLNTELWPVQQQVVSNEYGQLTLSGAARWLFSSRFGWTHFGWDETTYDGWVNTERFDWMKFVQSGENRYLWVPMMRSWMSVNADGTFYSFEWRHLTPQNLNRYHSGVFGGLTTGDFHGWVYSDRFGWMWANGDGTWFWSDSRQDWLGITAQGGIWSSSEQRFL